MGEEKKMDEVLVGEDREEFQNLLYLGRKTEEITVYGRVVEISTLNVWQELQVAELVRRWEGTPGYTKAYKAAVSAAALNTIDGEPFYTPLTPAEESEEVKRRFDLIKEYYPAFVDSVYEGVVKMERSLSELLEKLGKSHG